MDNGWIKLHRKILGNPIIMKDSDHLAIWTYLLLKATHTEKDVFFNGKRYTLQAGEFTTGRKMIAYDLSLTESKVQRVLKCFEIEQQIEQRTDRQCRLIKVLKWNEYQIVNNEMNNDRTTSEQRVNTKQECKNEIMKEVSTNVDTQATKKNKYNDKDFQTAKKLFALLISRNPAFAQKYKNIVEGEKTCQKWAADISLMIRIDNREYEQISFVLDWINSQAGEFWQSNILSGKKLREKYDIIVGQMQRKPPRTGRETAIINY